VWACSAFCGDMQLCLALTLLDRKSNKIEASPT
jgi:hypothetical protein